MSGRRALLVVAVALAASSCERAAPILERDLHLAIAVAPGEVELGRAFALTVVRTWKRELTPQPWSDASLAPLVLKRVDTHRREQGRHVEETVRCDAWAFARGELVVPAPSISAVDADGREHVATSEALRLKVRPLLDAKEPGAPELPEDPPDFDSWTRSKTTWIAGAVLLLLAAWMLRPSRKGPRLPPVTEPPSTPEARALARLQGLRKRAIASRDDETAWFEEAAALSRDFLVDRFDLPAPRRTSEELLEAPATAAALGPGRLVPLREVLGKSDLVKFADDRSTEAERTRTVAALQSLILGRAS